MILRKPSELELEALAHSMRMFAAQANALADALDKAQPENVIYTGDLRTSLSFPRDEFADGAVISSSPNPSELSITFEGNVHVRLTGAAAELVKPQRHLKPTSDEPV